ncbi:MAG: hypothetical protein AB1689_23290 [Thermodesulfobacteriota bacterium]
MQDARSWSSVVLLVAALAVPCAARAGVVIVTESEPPAKEAASAGEARKASARKGDLHLTGRLYASGKDVRLQGTRTDGDGKESGTVLFRGASDTIVVLNDRERTYFEISRADAKRLASSLESVRAQIRAQLETMSPEDRAAVEQAMQEFGGLGNGGAKKPPQPIKAVATGRTSEVEGRPCRQFDVQRGGKRIAEACVASWRDVGLEPDDLAGVRELAAFQRDVLEQVDWEGLESAPGSEVFELMEEIGGVPVRVRTMHEGKPIVVRVIDVQRKDIDPELFRVPTGYERTTLPG